MTLDKCILPKCLLNLGILKGKRRIKIFPFPKNDSDIANWCHILNLNINDVKEAEKTNCGVCSFHFRGTDFNYDGNTVVLKNNAVPVMYGNRNLQQEAAVPNKGSFHGISELGDSSMLTLNEGASLKSKSSNTKTNKTGFLSNEGHSSLCQPGPSRIQKLERSPNICPDVSPSDTDKNNAVSMKKNTKVKSIRILKRKLSEKRPKINNFKELLQQLYKMNLIPKEDADLLENCAIELPDTFFFSEKCGDDITYSEELKNFIMALKFFSPKGYNYVRESYKNVFPDENTIRRWYVSLNCEPGFLQEAFNTLEIKSRLLKEASKPCLCALVLGDMQISKSTEIEGSKIRGYVDLGLGDISDECTNARTVYVFILVSITEHWKIPIAYFFIYSLNCEQKANLITEALKRTHEVGVSVVSITAWDGFNVTKDMFALLGSDITLPMPKPYFTHPCDSNKRVYTLIDPDNVLKFVKFSFAANKELVSPSGLIKWKYIELLYKEQKEEEFKFGNRLSSYYIMWLKHKMRVGLETETICSSVADAIEFCNQELHIKEFEGSEATVEFLRIFEKAFDLLNSSNPFAKGSKAPLRSSNQEIWQKTILETQNYILKLRTISNIHLYCSSRSIGFRGFFLGMETFRLMFEDLVTNKRLLDYILPYKFFRDQIELFFCFLRSPGSCKNMPRASEVITNMKSLLYPQIKSPKANIKEFDGMKILQISSSVVPVEINERKMELEYFDIKDLEIEEDHYIPTPSQVMPSDVCNMLFESLANSELKEHAMRNISGYAVSLLIKTLKCTQCRLAMLSKTDRSHELALRIFLTKKSGGLMKPSRDVTFICLATDKVLNKYTSRLKIKDVNFLNRITLEILRNLDLNKLFLCLDDHCRVNEIDNNHIYKLTKNVILTYLHLKIRYLKSKLKHFKNPFPGSFKEIFILI